MNAMNPYIIPLLKTYDISVQIKDVKNTDSLMYMIADKFVDTKPIMSLYGEINTHELISEVKGRSRKQGVQDLRNLIMYFVKNVNNLTLKEVGKIFGGRDHSTVINNIQQYENACEFNKSIYRQHLDLCIEFNAQNKIKPLKETFNY